MSFIQDRYQQYLVATSDACTCEKCLEAITEGELEQGGCECDKHFCPCCGGDHACQENER